MNRKELLEYLGISLNTFKRWCSAHGIPQNQPEYSDDDLAKLQDCQEAMASGMSWNDYLRTLGKQSDDSSVGSALAQRYGKDVDKLAKPIAGGLVQALDNAVANEFSRLLRTTKSSVFGQLAQAFTLELETTDPIALLEAEIVEEDYEETAV